MMPILILRSLFSYPAKSKRPRCCRAWFQKKVRLQSIQLPWKWPRTSPKSPFRRFWGMNFVLRATFRVSIVTVLEMISSLTNIFGEPEDLLHFIATITTQKYYKFLLTFGKMLLLVHFTRHFLEPFVGKTSVLVNPTWNRTKYASICQIFQCPAVLLWARI